MARMRVVDRLALIDRIGRELQARFSFGEIKTYLDAFDVTAPAPYGNSKWVYSKDILSGAPEETVVRIAEELEITAPGSAGRIAAPPENWKDERFLRLFISHISVEKEKATRLKECLASYGISGFVAHEDIHPTLEWQREIERGLATMEAFVPILTKGFRNSLWTQQECGWAAARGVKIISLRMGEDPPGFLSREQALSRGRRDAVAIAGEIARLLKDDPRTAPRLQEAMKAAETDQVLA